ncbi:MAG: DUF393 domain-containing protein [Phycisphaerae bacterium]|nr:DUF393 domain-containing protein [Phycisphaerae bacterium]
MSHKPDWDLKILIDGECPLCRREGEFLRRLDAGRRRLAIEDITDLAFDPSKYGTTMEALMGQIHGVLPNGRLIKGMAVFRQSYAAVGLGWLLAPTNWPMIRPIADRCYHWFARNRLRLTGRDRVCQTGKCRVG